MRGPGARAWSALTTSRPDAPFLRTAVFFFSREPLSSGGRGGLMIRLSLFRLVFDRLKQEEELLSLFRINTGLFGAVRTPEKQRRAALSKKPRRRTWCARARARRALTHARAQKTNRKTTPRARATWRQGWRMRKEKEGRVCVRRRRAHETKKCMCAGEACELCARVCVRGARARKPLGRSKKTKAASSTRWRRPKK